MKRDKVQAINQRHRNIGMIQIVYGTRLRRYKLHSCEDMVDFIGY
jgi:hypothetical protein